LSIVLLFAHVFSDISGCLHDVCGDLSHISAYSRGPYNIGCATCVCVLYMCYEMGCLCSGDCVQFYGRLVSTTCDRELEKPDHFVVEVGVNIHVIKWTPLPHGEGVYYNGNRAPDHMTLDQWEACKIVH
jgi:hypothetical protein